MRLAGTAGLREGEGSEAAAPCPSWKLWLWRLCDLICPLSPRADPFGTWVGVGRATSSARFGSCSVFRDRNTTGAQEMLAEWMNDLAEWTEAQGVCGWCVMLLLVLEHSASLALPWDLYRLTAASG